jgi:hypothetical protein
MIRILILALFLSAPLVHAADAALLIDILECESAGRYNVVGDDGVSVGIAQFQRVTFDTLKRKAHHREWQWKNPVHQMRLLNWAIDHGYGRLWTCYRKIKKEKK